MFIKALEISKAVSCLLHPSRLQLFGYSPPTVLYCSTSRSSSIVVYSHPMKSRRGLNAQCFQCPNGYHTTTENPQVKADKTSRTSTALTEASEEYGGGSAVSTTMKEKVKENVKTSAYGGVVLLGIAVTGAMGYLILSELFSSDSPNSIYTKSFKLCKASEDVQNVLGEPLKCYGEESRKGWRRHVAHQKFMVGETKYIRMKFYLEGKFNKGTVYLEKKTDDQGKFKYSYLVVDVEAYPPRRIEVNVAGL